MQISIYHRRYVTIGGYIKKPIPTEEIINHRYYYPKQYINFGKNYAITIEGLFALQI
jgi:hypothetical protein